MKYDPEKDIWYEEGDQIFETHTVVRPDGTPRHQLTRLNNLKQAMPHGDASEISYDTNGIPSRKIWHEADLEHRVGAPARVVFHGGMDLPMTESYKINGQPISADAGPWRVRWNEDGTLWREDFHDKKPKTTPAGFRPKLAP